MTRVVPFTEMHPIPHGPGTHGSISDCRARIAKECGLRAALDIGYFRPGEVIVERNAASDQLHVIIKGGVEERDGDEICEQFSKIQKSPHWGAFGGKTK